MSSANETAVKLPETPRGWDYDGVNTTGAHSWSTFRDPYEGTIEWNGPGWRYDWYASVDLTNYAGGELKNEGQWGWFADAVWSVENQFKEWSEMQLPVLPEIGAAG